MGPYYSKLIFLIGTIFCGIGPSAFSQFIIGPDQVTAGETHTYTFDHGDYSNTPTECGELSTSLYRWWLNDPTGQTNYPPNPSTDITITFGMINGTVTLYIEFYCFEADLYYVRSKEITIIGAPPQLPLTPPPFSITENCFGRAVVQRPDPISPEVTYYWQTTEDGTSTQSSSKNINIETSQYLYLRAKNDVGWSTASSGGYVTVNGPSLIPPSDIYQCETDALLPISLPGLLNTGASQWKIVPTGMEFLLSNEAASNFTPIDFVNDYSEEFSQGRVLHLEYTVSQNGCVRTGYVSIYVKSNGARPTIQAQGPTNFCQGGSVVLQVQADGDSFQWLKDDQPLSGQTSHTYPATESGTFRFSHVNNNGCYNISAPFTITVRPLPTVTIASLESTAFCQGSDLTLEVQSNGNNFQWLRDGQLQGEATGQYTYQASQSGSYTVTAYLNGCSKTSAPVALTMLPLPTAAIQPSGSTAFCEGNYALLQAQSNGASFQWLRDGQLQASGTSPSYHAAQSGIYTLKAFSSQGCMKESDPVSVTTLPAPELSMQPLGPTIFCGGGSVQLQAQFNGVDFEWLKDGAVQMDASTLTYPVSQSGTYVFKGYGSNGCSKESSPVVVNAIPLPLATILTANGAVIPFGSTNVLLTASAGSGYAYRWYLNDQEIDGATGLTYSAPRVGNYKVEVTNAQGWSAISDATAVTLENDHNYIMTRVLTAEKKVDGSPITEADIPTLSEDQQQQRITYFDGLGRSMQHIAVKAAPARKDIVIPIAYDSYGREPVKYLPYAAEEVGGKYKKDALKDPETPAQTEEGKYRSGKQFQFYQGTDKVATDLFPYEKKIFAASPVNRILKHGAPGAAWQPDAVDSYDSEDRTIKRSYKTNTGVEVLLWTYTKPNGTYPLGLVNAGSSAAKNHYGENQLVGNKTKDEQGHEVMEYVDKEGRIVLKRVQAESDAALGDTGYASTYYIYDDLGNLVCVIPPEATRLITDSPSAYLDKTDAEKEAFLGKWAFRYRYDRRNRMCLKQVPGADSVRLVYDRRDRLVFTQDGNQRSLDNWSFTKYDAFDRPVMTGIYTHNAQIDQQAMAGLASTAGQFETYTGNASGHGYSNTMFVSPNFNTSEFEVLSVTYYDNYTFKNLINNTVFNYKNDELTATPLYKAQDVSPVLAIVGQVAGTKVKVLAKSTWLWTVNYYDNRYRVIQTVASTYKTEAAAGYNRITNIYDFADRVVRTKTSHSVSGHLERKIIQRFSYDHAGRLLKSWHQIEGNPEVLLSVNEYNALGQLVTKKLHQTMSGTPVSADPLVGQPGVLYGSTITSDSYNSAQHTYIASNRVKLRRGFNVQSGNKFKGRIGYSQQDALAHNNAIVEHFKQTVDYRYNIRGWLKQINDPSAPVADDLFNMDLQYNTPSAKGGASQYNGNISEAVWKSAGGDKQSYGYHYDPMNRITKGLYFDLSKPLANGRYDEVVGKEDDPMRPAYDLNDNILNLLRKGKTSGNTYGLVDDLQYKYTSGGNQLRYIADDVEIHPQEVGFKEISTGEGMTDYAYDANGNLIRDENKGISGPEAIPGIEYNHLNLPTKVLKGSDTITYTYDATGRKLAQQVSGSTSRITDYIGEQVFEGNVLQFILQPEGRVVMTGTTPEYQYFMKDHLGNTRVVFSERKKADEYFATMERLPVSVETAENSQFQNMDNSKKINWDLFNHTPGVDKNYSYRLSGVSGEVAGPAKSLAVNPGDIVDLEVYAKYNHPQSTGSEVSGLLSTLIGAFNLGAGPTPIDGQLAYDAFNNLFSDGPYIGRVPPYEDGAAPKAYLNYILFDESFDVEDFGFDQISTAANQENPIPPVAHELLSLHVKVKEKGYLYIYVSNENPTLVDVFFDDFKIVHYQGVEQVNDYYPFGLSFNSYQRENSVDQDYKFNGKEEQDELDLDTYDYGVRMYDPADGRWWSPDPLADMFYSYSPYNFSLNNPINVIDPDGRMALDVNNGRQDIASTFIGPDGKVIKHIDDDDHRVYFVADPSSWDGESKDDLAVIGFEDPSKTYRPGDAYEYYNPRDDPNFDWSYMIPAEAYDYSDEEDMLYKYYDDDAYLWNATHGDSYLWRLEKIIWRDLTADENRETVTEALLQATRLGRIANKLGLAHKRKAQSTGKAKKGKHEKGEARDKMVENDKKRQKPNFRRYDGKKKKNQ